MIEKQRILVVEDDMKIAEALRTRLRSAGYSVLLAADGVTGLGLAVKENPHLLLLDISMPAGGGFFVAEKLVKIPKLADVPFVFITALKKLDILDRARAFGAFATVEKPFCSEELLQVIERALAPANALQRETA